MAKQTHATISEYLADLPPDRRKALQAVRKVVRANLAKGFKEGIQYNMIGYFVPHSLYPKGYHCDAKQPLPFLSIASQKNHMAVYLFCIYTAPGAEDRFRKAWAKTGKKLDMGKSCVRFKKIEDVALDVLGDTIKGISLEDFIASYEKSLDRTPTPRSEIRKKAAAKKAAKKKTSKKKATKKTATRKTAKKAVRVASKKTAKKTTRRSR